MFGWMLQAVSVTNDKISFVTNDCLIISFMNCNTNSKTQLKPVLAICNVYFKNKLQIHSYFEICLHAHILKNKKRKKFYYELREF